ncbi:S8 family serine peptidase [Hymenobacter properus]|uniref:S8 family serine peptidase n=1 Tax=Hymenobacter properus TaxID=2791026 RepID=A0A931FH33_9BACT|nr:S8 family serine peptidase [Hymenobacter properus]MBF9140637.1 S8 family serine peptidase [Hymenobacter properus]MBR7719445.1 S8 family serine peptidase [Microvirga sp. SRT04]
MSKRLIKAGAHWALGGLVGLALLRPAGAQVPQPELPERYWVTFRDKDGVRFNPKQYFSPEARARRRRQHLPAYEASDLPVRADYVAAVRARVDTLTLESRWFNAVACRATSTQAAALRRLPGVRAVEAWPYQPVQVAAHAPKGKAQQMTPPPHKPLTSNDFLLARRQTAHLDGPALRAAGLEGQGMRIAVFDVGFRGVPTHPAFQELMASKRIVAAHDFLRGTDNVFVGGSHGTEVLGCLTGRLPGPSGEPGPALGLAPAAEYLLARTEQLHRERYAEEEAWLAAVEWADRLGADIINSSLAYTEQRYFPEQMDGRRSLIARAANLAARKGLLVVSAAGNDGDDDWVRIGTPADADSALAVGGLDPETGLHVDFSSYGPTADRRPKPNLAAFGIVLTTTTDDYERLEGTSFSSPLVAGFAACLWQKNRQLTAMQVFRALEKSAELYPYFDYAHGFGRPRLAHFAVSAAAPVSTPTFDFVPHDSLVAVVIRPEAALRPAEMLPLVAEQSGAVLPSLTPPAEGKPTNDNSVPRVGHEQPVAPGSAPLNPLPEPNYPAYLYWNLADRRGVLRRYETRAVTQRLVVQVPRRLLRGGDVLRVHFKGYTGTYSE